VSGLVIYEGTVNVTFPGIFVGDGFKFVFDQPDLFCTSVDVSDSSATCTFNRAPVRGLLRGQVSSTVNSQQCTSFLKAVAIVLPPNVIKSVNLTSFFDQSKQLTSPLTEVAFTGTGTYIPLTCAVNSTTATFWLRDAITDWNTFWSIGIQFSISPCSKQQNAEL
jgi:hypothetical protein